MNDKYKTIELRLNIDLAEFEIGDIKQVVDEMYTKRRQESYKQENSAREVKRKRLKERKEQIKKWCRTNLKKGMIVTVNSSAATKYRLVLRFDVGGNFFTSHHIKFDAHGEMKYGAYITEHYYHQINGVCIINENMQMSSRLTTIQMLNGEYKSKENHLVK